MAKSGYSWLLVYKYNSGQMDYKCNSEPNLENCLCLKSYFKPNHSIFKGLHSVNNNNTKEPTLWTNLQDISLVHSVIPLVACLF